ncbi:M61 family metallopeptidase [Glacieibacterium frigidum]|uniref:M61 family peptidase n=1 Tax=Glacieibacterium frigidum TaxID=2593303 RepID=A0A552UGY8_9SPHN|nr:M61 family peptidase [Glacieibacterium frigidum]TRW17485.1 M61 family peptidase [Glacieibacterium frigidum]
MRRSFAALAALTLLAAAPAPVTYRLSPVLTDGALSAVTVEIGLTGDADGTTVLALPDDFGGVDDHWKLLGRITATGAQISGTGAKRTLTARPGAPIRVRYTVRTAYAADPAEAEGNPYRGAVIRPAWFASLGEFLFATPEGRDGAAARFAWVGWPAAWRTASDLDHPGLTVGEIGDSSLLAGPDVVVRTRPISGGTLRLATRGSWDFDLDTYADTMARVIGAQRDFWGDVRGPFTVTLYELAPSPGSLSSGGTGRSDGFAQYAGGKTQAADLLRNIAHEHIHTWIARRLGTLPDGPSEAGLYWLSEGFTDFYAARTLLRSGLWGPDEFVADLNAILVALATSPVRDAPNARIVADFWRDRRVERLPYQRGAVLALLLDERTRGRGGLDRILFAMRDAMRRPSKPALRANFIAAARRSGLDARPLLTRHVDAGAPVVLPPTLFGGCVRVENIQLAVFDPGFDRDASAKAGAITGVDPAGPAYAAGLRDGMKRLARIAGTEGDSRKTLSYRIADAAGERVIAWLPAGRTRVALQQLVLAHPLPAGCARAMGGAAD